MEIYEIHQKMLTLMRTFVPPPEKKRRKTDQREDLQIGLFEEAR